MEAVLLELQYLPPVQYFTKWLHYPAVWLEAHEHYQKGSYRNRAYIAGANGILRLSIPLEKGKNEQQAIRAVRIAYYEPWQKQHWESIQSAYGSAPFFFYYADFLQPFYEKRYEYLWDWNWDLLQMCRQFLGLTADLQFTTAFSAVAPSGVADWRNVIHPKPQRQRRDPHFQPAQYVQVFEEKHGFLANLSILDLLFCTGPEATQVLWSSWREA